MKPVIIRRGVYRLTMKGPDYETQGGWEDDPNASALLVADISEGESESKLERASIIYMGHASALLEEIRERLDLPEADDLPDIRRVAKRLCEEGLSICDFCEGWGTKCQACSLEDEREERDE